MKLNYQFKHFQELTTSELHDIIAVRLKTFVVEQNCCYLDLDGKDKKSYHAICREGKGEIVATARILPAGISYNEVSLGRFVINTEFRGSGLGHNLMQECHRFIKEEFGNCSIRISAQKHLENFYNQHLFFSTNKEYLEDGIPHVEMLFTPTI